MLHSLTHIWDAGTAIEDTLHALNDLVRSGKVHYIGVSNVLGWQLQKIVDLNNKFGYPQIVSLQVTCNARGERCIRVFMTTGSVQFTVQRNRVGVGTGLSAGEYIYVTMESTKGVRCVKQNSHSLFQSVIVCRGMLTGKFKRDAAPTDPSSS